MKAVSLLSGGLDSTTLAYHLRDLNVELITLSFNYGQRHIKELDAAQKIADLLDAPWHVIEIGTASALDDDLAPLGSILAPSNSVLVDHTKPVPDGHYAEDNMKQTVVPNRNAIMLSIAYGVALANNANLVAFAAHSGDHRIYPDCRVEFVDALGEALKIGSAWTEDERSSLPQLAGLFLDWDKAMIAKEAVRLNVPVELTWSCYKGGDIHCGTCGTCYERREAFQLAGVPDPTPYLDNTTVFPNPVEV